MASTRSTLESASDSATYENINNIRFVNLVDASRIEPIDLEATRFRGLKSPGLVGRGIVQVKSGWTIVDQLQHRATLVG